MATPNSTPAETKPSTSTISTVISEITGFVKDEVGNSKKEIEDLFNQLEEKIAPILKPFEAKIAVDATNTVNEVKTDEKNSPLYSALQDVKVDVQSVKDHYSSIKNKLTTLIGRIHL